MNRFSATTQSEAIVAAERSRIWAVLTDAELLPTLTPLLRRIETDGDLWRWHMVRIAALGVNISPVFTERMRFDEERRIEYSHAPPQAATEHTGAEGWYQLADAAGGTHLAISLTLHVDLPLARVAAPAVSRVMKATIDKTGERFSANLLQYLNVAAGR
ncbi:MAG: SRPBCC family protein [Actinomycetota bacterium]|nr:SRPBCC family protein [Actinomycetota bacterium]